MWHKRTSKIRINKLLGVLLAEGIGERRSKYIEKSSVFILFVPFSRVPKAHGSWVWMCSARRRSLHCLYLYCIYAKFVAANASLSVPSHLLKCYHSTWDLVLSWCTRSIGLLDYRRRIEGQMRGYVSNSFSKYLSYIPPKRGVQQFESIFYVLQTGWAREGNRDCARTNP